MRKFETYTEEKKTQVLLFALALALSATEAEKKATRDVYELAAKNGKVHGLVAEDFQPIKQKTISQLVTTIKP